MGQQDRVLRQIQVPVAVRMLEKYGKDITLCPKCSLGKLELIHIDYGARDIKISKTHALLSEDKTTCLAPP